MMLKSLVMTRNKIGPSLVPWWTSAAQGVSLGKILLTRCVLLRWKLPRATGATSYQTGIYRVYQKKLYPFKLKLTITYC